jgi:hypothetical protein
LLKKIHQNGSKKSRVMHQEINATNLELEMVLAVAHHHEIAIAQLIQLD